MGRWAEALESPQCLASVTHIKHVSRGVLGCSLDFSARGTYPLSSFVRVTVGTNEMTRLEVLHQCDTGTNFNSESWLYPTVFFILVSCHLRVSAVWHIQKEATYFLPPGVPREDQTGFRGLAFVPSLDVFLLT